MQNFNQMKTILLREWFAIARVCVMLQTGKNLDILHFLNISLPTQLFTSSRQHRKLEACSTYHL